MWRRAYLLLALLRLYIALRPSYLHPDEHFQGPEVIAGRIYGWQVLQTWEFASETPMRGALPLWIVYGTPMTLIKWLSEGSGHGLPRPATVFYALRAIMFLLSFVLEDWAIHELIDVPRHRRTIILLIASSYVTCTWQVHTFSNSIETLLVAWSLVLLKRIKEHKDSRPRLSTPATLGIFLVLGTYTRITFPAYLLIPCVQLVPELMRRPSTLLALIGSVMLTGVLAVFTDTAFYSGQTATIKDLFLNPVVTPLNALRYNTNDTNLALHGTHPFYQHFLVNIPQLLAPALPLLLTTAEVALPLISAISGTAILSLVSHQEARFLLPAIPLLLASVKLPRQFTKAWIAVWVFFNVALVLLMGIYHQGGVVPAQMWLERQTDFPKANVFWWKTYSPPTWLLDGRIEDLKTYDLMGLPSLALQDTICKYDSDNPKLLVAPGSAVFLEYFQTDDDVNDELLSDAMTLRRVWSTNIHISLDDLDFGDDGIFPTLARVIGKRGLAIWKVGCPAPDFATAGSFLKDW